MAARKRRDHIPEILVALSLYPCGVFLSFLLHSFYTVDLDGWRGSRDYSFVWAPLSIAGGAFAVAFVLFFCRAIAKRIVWLHYYLLALGSLLMLASGIVLVNSWTWVSRWSIDYTTSTVLGGLGHGMVYVSGLMYIHFRTGSYKHRVARLGLAHLSLAIGFVSSASQMSFRFAWPSRYPMYGYFFLYSCASIVVVFVFNELFHGLGVYNYKQCLDAQLYEADFKRDRLQSALTDSGARKRLKQFTLSLTAIASKIISGFLFNMIFLFLTLISQAMNIGSYGMIQTIPGWCILTGVILGMIMSLRVRTRIVYPVMLLGMVVFLSVSAILYTNGNYGSAAVFFWFFYLCGGAAYIVPDAAIMEISSVKWTELSLFFGLFLEQIPILVSIYYVREEMVSVVYKSHPLWTHVGIFIGLALIVCLLWFIVYPNTFHKRVLEIQRLVLFNDKRPWRRDNPMPYVTPTGPPVPQPPPASVGFIPVAAPVTVGHIPPTHTYFSNTPVYPGQRPVYVLQQQPPYFGPPQAAAAAAPFSFPVSMGASSMVSAEDLAKQGTAPQLTPVTETEQVLRNVQYEPPPPPYDNVIRSDRL